MSRTSKLFDLSQPLGDAQIQQHLTAMQAGFDVIAQERFPGVWRIASNCLMMGYELGLTALKAEHDKAEHDKGVPGD